jgi:hypothetical protein
MAILDLSHAAPDRTPRAGATFGTAPVPLEPVGPEDILIAALGRRFSVFDTVAIDPGPGPRRDGGGNLTPLTAGTATFDVPVTAGENAVVLLAQDGAYSWHFPNSPATVDIGTREAGAPAGKVVRIKVAGIEAGASSPWRMRGILGELLIAPVRAWILKFLAKGAVQAAVAYLERDTAPGFVALNADGPSKWRRVVGIDALSLPTDRPARILLFLHGTFSSTVGSFAALAAYPWGRALLEQSGDGYDAILGYDHPTLSVDPQANASDLLSRLNGRAAVPPDVDIVGFCRGGLVSRCLLGRLASLEAPPVRVRRVVFVAVPNGGTSLAEPDNWRTLIDLYTNITTAACQLIGIALPGNVVTDILGQAINGLGDFVTYMAEYAIDQEGVPGLAAMCPGSPFIAELNRAADLADIERYGVFSEFESRLFDEGHEPQELPRRFLLRLFDRVSDQLMGRPNDLVVNTDSMSRLGAGTVDMFKDGFNFGKTPFVYHTIYFTRPEVCLALARWLGLDDDRIRILAGDLLPPTPRPRGVRGGQLTGGAPPLPGDLESAITVMPADATVADLRAMFRREAPACVVLQRIHNGAVLHYALTDEEAKGALDHPDEHSLYKVFGLDERDATREAPPEGPFPPPPRTRLADPAAARLLVVDDGRIEGVLPSAPESASNLAVVSHASSLALGGLGRRIGNFRGDGIIVGRESPMAQEGLPPSTTPVDPDVYPDMLRAPDPDPGASIGFMRLFRRDSREAAASPSDGDNDAHVLGSYSFRRGAPAPDSPPDSASPDLELLAPVESSLPNASGVEPEEMLVTVHVLAECRALMQLDELNTVVVTLSRESLEAALGTVSANAAAIKADATRKVTIEIWARRNVEIQGKSRCDVDVPAALAAARIPFDVRPTAIGPGELTIMVRQANAVLAELNLRFQIDEKAGDAWSKAAGSATAVLPASGEGNVVPQLMAIEYIANNQTRYNYILQLPGIFDVFESPVIQSDRVTYVKSLYDQLERRWTGSTAAQSDFQAELEAFGVELFEGLFPETMRRILWEKRDLIRDIVVIALEEPFIPWEMVYVKEPGRPISADSFFLADRGMVRWLTGRPMTAELRMRAGKLRTVIPDYKRPPLRLPNAAIEGQFLSTLGATPVDPFPESVRALLRAEDAFDLLHFACHGEADPQNIRLSNLLLQERPYGANVEPTYFQSSLVAANGWLDLPAGRRPIVMLNACQTGRTGLGLTGIGGFAAAFLKAGAGCFIGALWSVDDKAALEFTKAFYTALTQGKPLAFAATAGRQAAKASGDASWLSYTVYGHPQAKVRNS